MARKYRVWLSVPRAFRTEPDAPECSRIPGNVEVVQDVFAYTQEEALEQVRLLIRTDGRFYDGKIFNFGPHPDAIPKEAKDA